MKPEDLVAALVALIRQAVAAELDARATAAADPQRSLKTAQVATILAVDPSYVLRLAKAGELESTGKGRGRRFTMAGVEKYRARTLNVARGITPRTPRRAEDVDVRAQPPAS